MLWQVSTTCLLAVAVLGSLGLVSGKLEALPAGWMEKDPRVKHVQGMAHTTVEEIVKELKQEQVSQPDGLRFKRQSGGEPVVEGRQELNGADQPFAVVYYFGEENNVILVLTYDYREAPYVTHLFRSTDHGSNFTDISDSLGGSPLWRFFYISPTNRNMVVIPHLLDPVLFYSMDAGDTWATQEFDPNTINPRSLLWNPTEDNWIIGHDDTNDRLYVSQNLGETWIKIADYVSGQSNYEWGVPGVDSNKSIIYFNVYDSRDQSRDDFTVDLYTQKYPYTDDTRQEFDPNLGRHNGFVITGLYIFADKEINGEVTLFVSYNREPFNEALIPSTLPHLNYFVAHINSLQALVIVEHTVGQFNLYLSEITGVYFSLSVPDIVFEDTTIELQLIEGVNGTMIANQYVREDPSESNPPVRTLITLDNGGTWEPLRAPRDAANPCELPLCSLHFHMDTSEYARLGVYSEASAPGIIVAHGTAGTELSDDPDLYISRDGGISWEKTLDGSWGVSVLDHGGLMVAARDYHHNTSNEIMYTCDEGISWQSFVFLGSNITVYGVVTQPGEITTTVSLYGDEDEEPYYWIIVTINFTDIFPRICNDSDYYDWMPWDGRLGGDLCVLGSTVTIQRRRAEVCCLNQREYVREFDFQICNCTSKDFECDYGYKRALGTTGPCIRDTDVVVSDPCANDDGATYDETTGYRKIPGDVCEDGDDSIFLPYPATCQERSSEPCFTDEEEEGGGIALGIIFLLLIGAAVTLSIVTIILAWKLYKSRPKPNTQPVESFSYAQMSASESASALSLETIESEGTKTPIPQ